MSEFRLFCLGAFFGDGLFAAACNHGVIVAPGSVYEQFLSVGFLAGCVAVTMFGRKSA